MMAIELYKHNKEAYEKIEKMFEYEDKVAIVHATGTGKSFISLKWLYENRDKNCLFLAPTYEIIDQLEHHIKTQGLSISDFPNLKTAIYPNFYRLSSKQISDLKFDNIVLDEFHRCGAHEWGKSINELLANNPNAKVLGITATPIRYLDDNRNMAEELFHGNIASEITLIDAIANGILPMPTYISTVYSFKEDIERIQSKIDRFENPEYKEAFQKKLNEARRMLENAKGLSEIFEKHIPNKNGKYIVFCRDYEHMKKMMVESQNWFSKVNPNVDIYSVYSNQGRDANKQNIYDFENSSNEHIKLLFSMEMLNEGIHVEDVDGVIMLRPTVSPIIYLQQLGRALSVGHNEHPIVFDIVNNINCNKSIYEVYDEVKKKLLTNIGNGDHNPIGDDISLDEFKIFDEMKQFSDFIEMLDTSLNHDVFVKSKCEIIIKKVLEFKRVNGKMPSLESKIFEERSLKTAFQNYKKYFDEGQIRLLEENGINVIPKTSEEIKEETVYNLLEWLDSHDGKMPSGSSEDFYERRLYGNFAKYKGSYTDEQKRLLNSRNIKTEARRGMTSEDIIQEIVEEIIEFKKINGRMPSTTNGGYEDSLYQKFNRNKKNYKTEQLKLLADAGIEVVIESDEKRMARKISYVEKVIPTINAIIEFKKNNNRMPSDSAESLEERSLYQLFLRTKEFYTPDQISYLADNGIVIKEKRKNSIEEILEDSVDAIIMFIIENNKMPSGKSKNKQEESLYNSFKRNKTRYSNEQKQRLFDAGAPVLVDDSFIAINSLSIQEQIEIYSKLALHYKEINNNILSNYYLKRIALIHNGFDTSSYQGGTNNGIRRKN